MAFNVSFLLVDAYGRTMQKTYEAEATTLAQAITDGGSLLADLLAASELGSVQVSYTSKEVVTNAAAAGSNRDAGATIRVRLDNGKVYPFKLPAPEAAIINADGTIDISNALVTGLIAHFQSGGEFTVSEGDLVVSILGGELDK